MFETIIDPTVGPAESTETGGLTLAPRPERLAGLRLGLLANTKRNAEQFLADVGRELADRYGIVPVVSVRKPNIVETAPAELMAELTEQCDIVVAGVGDCGSCSASAVADGILLEQAGIPAAVIVSDAFTVSADAMAGLRNAPGYTYVTTPHPVANLTAEGVQARAAQAVPAIVALLTEPVMAAATSA
ncbi:MAG TPA: UGSC family (seleno)protein [Streptosporangiaceae bacterium]|nr:UGSC family (seleno)protein [Streptosporangiaceae bacterium]